MNRYTAGDRPRSFGSLGWVFGSYSTILRIPGALAFSAAAFVGRLPISMYGLGFVLLVQPISHSYAIAGTFSATFTIAGAIGSPFTSRYVDRWGQNRVSPWLTLVSTVTLAVTVVVLVVATPVPAGQAYTLALRKQRPLRNKC